MRQAPKPLTGAQWTAFIEDAIFEHTLEDDLLNQYGRRIVPNLIDLAELFDDTSTSSKWFKRASQYGNDGRVQKAPWPSSIEKYRMLAAALQIRGFLADDFLAKPYLSPAAAE